MDDLTHTLKMYDADMLCLSLCLLLDAAICVNQLKLFTEHILQNIIEPFYICHLSHFKPTLIFPCMFGQCAAVV